MSIVLVTLGIKQSSLSTFSVQSLLINIRHTKMRYMIILDLKEFSNEVRRKKEKKTE